MRPGKAVEVDRGSKDNRSRTHIVALICAVAMAFAMLTGCAAQRPVGPLADPDYTSPPDDVPEIRDVPMAGTVEPPETGAFIGVFRPPAPFTVDTLDDYTTISDKPPALLMWFQPWAESGSNEFDTAAVVATLRRGAIPLITWEPWDPGVDPNLVVNPGEQPEYRLQRIVDGEFDEYIRDWARKIAHVGGPVMMRPMHEMNGEWYPWGVVANGNTPEQFVAAWRRIHGIFEEEGATNVTWVWSINRASSSELPKNETVAYYPGDEYVDWTGISGFNWGDSRPELRWRAFDELYRDPIDYLTSVGKPIVISEFGSVETPGDKAAWMEDAYRSIRSKYPGVKAVVYYDRAERGLKGVQDWNIDSSPESLAAYQEAVSDPYFISAPAPTLAEWAAQMTGRDWAYLHRARRIY